MPNLISAQIDKVYHYTGQSNFLKETTDLLRMRSFNTNTPSFPQKRHKNLLVVKIHCLKYYNILCIFKLTKLKIVLWINQILNPPLLIIYNCAIIC